MCARMLDAWTRDSALAAHDIGPPLSAVNPPTFARARGRFRGRRADTYIDGLVSVG